MINTHSLDLEATSSQYATVVSSADTAITSDISIECWVKFESLPADEAYAGLVCKDRTAAQQQYSMFFRRVGTDAAGQYRFTLMVWNGGNNYAVWKLLSFSTATWYHLAITWTAATDVATFYVNAVSQGTGNTSVTSTQAGTSPVDIGWSSAYSGYLDGLIDEVRIWSDVRTSTEISNNYQVELNGNEGNLVAYYMFDDSNAEDRGTITDPTGAIADDLTLTGSPVYSTDVPFVGTIAYTQTLTKAISLVDTISRTSLGFRQTLTDIIALVDAGITLVYLMGVNIIETITLVDTRTLQTNFRKTIDEIITLVDSGTTVALRLYVALTETISLSDLIHIPGTWWSWLTKHTTAWTHQTKNTTNWTQQSKNTTSWTWPNKSDL